MASRLTCIGAAMRTGTDIDGGGIAPGMRAYKPYPVRFPMIVDVPCGEIY